MRFIQLLEQGTEAICQALQQNIGVTQSIFVAHPEPDGRIVLDVYPSGETLWLLLIHPQIGPLLPRLLGVMSRMREAGGHEFNFPAGQLQLPGWIKTIQEQTDWEGGNQ